MSLETDLNCQASNDKQDGACQPERLRIFERATRLCVLLVLMNAMPSSDDKIDCVRRKRQAQFLESSAFVGPCRMKDGSRCLDHASL